MATAKEDCVECDFPTDEECVYCGATLCEDCIDIHEEDHHPELNN